MKRAIQTLGLAGLLLATPLVIADEVEDAIHEGQRLYKEGRLTEAASQLSYAAQLISQQKGDRLAELLPAPLKGWEAQEAQSNTAGQMFGGGITVTREYTTDGKELEISLNADSPIVQTMMAMLSNPMMASASGAKIKQIQNHRFILTDKNGQLEAVSVINNSIVLTLKGTGLNESELKAYIDSIDFNSLSSV